MNDTKEDKKEFAAIMKALALQSKEEIGKPLLALYFMALKDYELSEIKNVAARLIKVWKYEYGTIPSIAVMVKALDGDQDPEDRALVMSTLIIDHMRRHGSGIHPDLSHDPVADFLMKTRWPYTTWASRVLENEIKWWVKEFSEAYKAHVKTDALQIENTKPIKQLIDTVGKNL